MMEGAEDFVWIGDWGSRVKMACGIGRLREAAGGSRVEAERGGTCAGDAHAHSHAYTARAHMSKQCGHGSDLLFRDPVRPGG